VTQADNAEGAWADERCLLDARNDVSVNGALASSQKPFEERGGVGDFTF